MRLGKSKAVIVALACSMAGVHVALAKPVHRGCGYGARTCHCEPKHDSSSRYRQRLIAGFVTEYDVEKWEKAYRQGRAQSGSSSRQRLCGADL